MEITAKFFDELTNSELYEIIRARAAVFVVEQNCIYQDLDGQDQKSLHVILKENEQLAAYLRVIPQESGCVCIGRVLSLKRGCGYGMAVLQEGIQLSHSVFAAKEISIEAQCYAVGFYEKVGFQICSEEFLEDGIPHICMKLAKH